MKRQNLRIIPPAFAVPKKHPVKRFQFKLLQLKLLQIVLVFTLLGGCQVLENSEGDAGTGSAGGADPIPASCRQAPLQYTSQTHSGWLETHRIQEKITLPEDPALYPFRPNVPVDARHIAMMFISENPKLRVCVNRGRDTCFGSSLHVEGEEATVRLPNGNAPSMWKQRSYKTIQWSIFPYDDLAYPDLPQGTYEFPLYMIESPQYFQVLNGGTKHAPIYREKNRSVNVQFQYQRSTRTQPRLPLNLFVLASVIDGVNNPEGVLADVHIQGAIQEMKRLVGEHSPFVAIDVRVCYLENTEQYAISNSHQERDEMYERLTSTASDKRFNVFIADQIADYSGSVVGLSTLYGPFGRGGTPYSGLLTEYLAGATMGKTILHELGHFIGLKHTTETNRTTFDDIADTPECPVGTNPCPDITNIMFPVSGYTNTNYFSEGQNRILFSNPLVTP